MIYPSRMTAEIDGDFVVFLIGMRINRLWKIWKWLPILNAMPPMLSELASNPETGYLGSEVWFGRTIISVQYWRSTDHLIRYAKNKSANHLPAWRAFNREVGTNGDVGIWHETFEVKAGGYECIYANMPKFGLAKAARHVKIGTGTESAKGRLGQEDHE